MGLVRSFLLDRRGGATETFLMGGCVLAFMAVVAVKTLDRLVDQEVAARQSRTETLASAEAAKDGIDHSPTGSIDPDRASHVALDPCKASVAADIGLRP